MESSFGVVVADQDRVFCQALASEIVAYPAFRLLAVVHDGFRALKAVEKHDPRLLIIDLVDSSGMDAIAVLDALNGREPRPKSVIISARAEDSYIARAVAHGADYYIAKPFDMSALIQRITQLLQPSPGWQYLRERRQRRVEHRVAQLLRRLGMPSHFLGFRYLQTAIAMVVDDPSLLNHVTRSLYSEVARQHGSSWSKVERSMRHAVEATWEKGDLVAIHGLFGHAVDRDRAKPTNCAFIARLADHVRMQARLDWHSFSDTADNTNDPLTSVSQGGSCMWKSAVWHVWEPVPRS
ncbi:MAG: sporulation transcription factor Spo0A [Firmicutes bacterium]|nr:sporulation transcription factor Spo0A [Bacillota bacterium]